MTKEGKLGRAVIMGLAAITLSVAGLVHGPATKDKFSKWFNKPKVEIIEKQKVEMKEEKKLPDIEVPQKPVKSNDEFLEGIALEDVEDVRALLQHLDTQGAGEKEKEDLIRIRNKIMEDSYKNEGKNNAVDIFSEIVMNGTEINDKMAEDYIEVFNTLMEDTEGVPPSKYNRFSCMNDLSNRAEETKLTGGALEAMRAVLENSEEKRYVVICFFKFLESCSVNYPFDEEFGLRFAEMANKILEYSEHDPDIWDVFYRSMYNPEINPYMINENYAKRLLDLTLYVRKNSSKKEREKMMKVLRNILMSSGSEYLNTVDLDNGVYFAQTLGFGEFEVGLNFAFAINAIGEEKTKELHEEYGIVYFGRYSKNIFEEIYKNRDPEYKKDKPVMLAVYNKSDWNGASYKANFIFDKLKEPYKISLYEVSNELGFRNALKETYKTHGKMDLLLIEGHGQPDNIALGEYDSDFYQINTSDAESLKNLKYLFNKNPKIILSSCSTGNNVDSIGAMLSEVWSAEVWAPVDPSRVPFFSYDKNGKMEEMEYMWTEIRKFKNGKSIKTKPARVDK